MERIMDFLTHLMMPRVAIPARRVDREILSVDRYLKMSEEERADVASAEVVPPTVGGNGFGFFRVHWKTSKYLSR